MNRILITGASGHIGKRVAELLSGQELRLMARKPEKLGTFTGAEKVVETWIGSYLAIAAGEVALVSKGVKDITNQEPMSLETYFIRFPLGINF